MLNPVTSRRQHTQELIEDDLKYEKYETLGVLIKYPTKPIDQEFRIGRGTSWR